MLYAKQNTIAGFHVYADHLLSFLESTPEAQPLLERFGYTVQRLQEGRQLLEQAKVAAQTVQVLREQQKASTRTVHEDWKIVRRRYQVQAQTARRVLGSDMPVTVTATSDTRGYSRWVSEAVGFYNAILNNPAFLHKLSLASITADELARSAQLIQELMSRKVNQTVSRRSVLDGNQSRQQQQQAAELWIRELLRVAPMAFRNAPGLRASLEALAPRPVQLVKKAKKNAAKESSNEAEPVANSEGEAAPVLR